MEKELLIVIKSAPFRNLNYYEGLRTAAGLWDHTVKILWTGKGIFGALNMVDSTLTKKFLTDLPDIDIEMYVDGQLRDAAKIGTVHPALSPVNSIINRVQQQLPETNL